MRSASYITSADTIARRPVDLFVDVLLLLKLKSIASGASRRGAAEHAGARRSTAERGERRLVGISGHVVPFKAKRFTFLTY